VIDTGLRATKQLNASTWRKLVKEQYFYSGGSLREFCRVPEMLRMRAWSDCVAVRDIHGFQLMYSSVLPQQWIEFGVRLPQRGTLL
jgi:hypothetical protein